MMKGEKKRKSEKEMGESCESCVIAWAQQLLMLLNLTFNLGNLDKYLVGIAAISHFLLNSE